jgi:PAS domain-containing protein
MKNLPLGKNKVIKQEIFQAFNYTTDKTERNNQPNLFDVFWDVLDKYMYNNWYKAQLVTQKFAKPFVVRYACPKEETSTQFQLICYQHPECIKHDLHNRFLAYMQLKVYNSKMYSNSNTSLMNQLFNIKDEKVEENQNNNQNESLESSINNSVSMNSESNLENSMNTSEMSTENNNNSEINNSEEIQTINNNSEEIQVINNNSENQENHNNSEEIQQVVNQENNEKKIKDEIDENQNQDENSQNISNISMIQTNEEKEKKEEIDDKKYQNNNTNDYDKTLEIFLLSILDKCDSGVILFNSDGFIVNMNKKAKDLFEFDDTFGLTKHWMDIIDPQHIPTSTMLFNHCKVRVIAETKTYNLQYIYTAKGGKTNSFLINSNTTTFLELKYSVFQFDVVNEIDNVELKNDEN